MALTHEWEAGVRQSGSYSNLSRPVAGAARKSALDPKPDRQKRRNPFWKEKPMLRKLASPLFSVATIGGLVACAQSTPVVKKEVLRQETAAPVAAGPTSDVDPHRLCEVYREVADAAYLGQRLRARKEFEADRRKHPQDRAAVFGELLAIPGENDRWKAFRKDGEANPASGVGPLGECLVYADWKLADQAKIPCARADEKLPGAAIVQFARGQLAASSGDAQAAKAHFEKALSIDPACTPAQLSLAEMHEKSGDLDTAIAGFGAAFDAAPDCITCIASKADLLEQTQGIDAALSSWEKLLEIVPDHAQTLKRYAAGLVGKDDARALAAYEKAIVSGSAERSTLLAAAKLANEIGDINKALDYAERASQMQADDLEMWQFMFSLYQKKDDLTGLERVATEILRFDPANIECRLVLAEQSKSAGRHVSVLDHLEAAVVAASGEGADPAMAERARNALSAFLSELGVNPNGINGSIDAVIQAVETRARQAFQALKDENPSLKGRIDLTLTTDKSGKVVQVAIKRDSLGVQRVAASLLADFRRATIQGGAKRYALELEFE